MNKIAGCILILCLLAACKSAATGTAGTAGVEAGVAKSEEAFFASALSRSFRFHTLSAQLKVELKSPDREMSSRAQLKMIHDDRIQLSFQPLFGIEVFRIEVTGDSVKMLDRLNKCYMADSYERIRGEAPFAFNFHNLQALLANRLFIPGEQAIAPDGFRLFRIRKDRNSVSMRIRDDAGMTYTFTAGGDERLHATAIRDASGRLSLTWAYRDFQAVGKQHFPCGMEAEWTSGKRLRGAVALSFSTPEVDIPLKTDFFIPSGYTRVSFAQIFQSLNRP